MDKIKYQNTIVLLVKVKAVTDNIEIVKMFNSYFANLVKSLKTSNFLKFFEHILKTIIFFEGKETPSCKVVVQFRKHSKKV